MEIIIYGTINSIILSLLSLGFALTYSISRLPNFAHGSLYILTGYVTWLFMNRLLLGYLPSILLSILITAIAGLLIYNIILKRIRGMEISEIIATYAIALAIIEGLRWGGLRGAVHSLPPFVSGSLMIFDVPVDYQRLLICALALFTYLSLYIFTKYTKLGLALRGIAQDERASMMLGIDSDLVASLSLALGSGLAGFSAVLILPLGNIVVEAGYNVLISSIAVCIVGGLGSWAGTLIASFLIGYAQILTDRFLSSHFQMVVALLAIIITLIIKPSGLFGKQKELEERV